MGRPARPGRLHQRPRPPRRRRRRQAAAGGARPGQPAGRGQLAAVRAATSRPDPAGVARPRRGARLHPEARAVAGARRVDRAVPANDTDHRLELFRAIGSVARTDVRLDDPPPVIDRRSTRRGPFGATRLAPGHGARRPTASAASTPRCAPAAPRRTDRGRVDAARASAAADRDGARPHRAVRHRHRQRPHVPPDPHRRRPTRNASASPATCTTTSVRRWRSSASRSTAPRSWPRAASDGAGARRAARARDRRGQRRPRDAVRPAHRRHRRPRPADDPATAPGTRAATEADLRSHLDLDLRDDSRPPRITERELWQIVREAIINVEKHAQASLVTVRYAARPDHVRSACATTVSASTPGAGVPTATA